MDDKLKVFWNLDILVKMCRSKSDGPSLRIEEEEIDTKIKSYKQEIEEIKSQTEEESYDTSAEMADRNIEIITKKQLQTLKTTLKEKNKELNLLKNEENHLYNNTSLLRETKKSQEKYITSMQERVNEATDYDTIDRYNALIASATEKITQLANELDDESISYEEVQNRIMNLSDEINTIEEKIDKKKKLLAETQANLENRDNYIDKTKKEKSDKKIYELEVKIQKLELRLEEIKKDPKYLESKIKDVINNREDNNDAKKYLVDLINIVIRQPYINVPADNSLEEELLKATQARDTFANEMDQKSYNILEANTPEKIRIEFLTERIAKWQQELEILKQKVEKIDKDEEFYYEKKNQQLHDMIQTMKTDLNEFQRAYEDVPDINIGAKASIKAALDEKREDIIEAEKIATAFRKDESEDIAIATRTIKYECEELNQNILNAEDEIFNIKNRLTSKKAGLIDITTKNKDKDTLKELAQIVIDIKHRRQFAETPIEIIHRLEEELGIDLVGSIDKKIISDTSTIEVKDYDEYIEQELEVLNEVEIENDLSLHIAPKRGIKVITETEIVNPMDILADNTNEELEEAIENIEEAEKRATENQENILNEETDSQIKEDLNDEDIKQDIIKDEIAEEIIEEEPILDDNTNSTIETSIEQPEVEEKSEESELAENSIEEEVEEVEEQQAIAEDEDLDIEAIIDSVSNKDEEIKENEENDEDLSINSMFNSKNSNTRKAKNDNIVSEDLTNELDEYLSNLDKEEA